jgi:hypothetical protein
MLCQLRPLVYSLGLNNPLRICLTPRKLYVKNLWHHKQGNLQCKMEFTVIISLAKLCGQMQRFATTGIATWALWIALKCTVDCQARWQSIYAARSGLCQSVLKFRLLTVAFRSAVILFVAILGLNTADWHNLQHTLGAELSKWVKSSSRHFTSRVPLFDAQSVGWKIILPIIVIKRLRIDQTYFIAVFYLLIGFVCYFSDLHIREVFLGVP